MIKPEQINSDKVWMNATLSVFNIEFSHVASKNIGTYNKVFVRNIEELSVSLRDSRKDYSVSHESEYFIHIRVLLKKYHELAMCCTSTFKLAGHHQNMLQVTGNLINDIKSVENIQQVKGHFNDIIQIIRNYDIASQPAIAK